MKKNAKGTWKILNQIINKNHRSSKLPSTFTINNLEISDPSLIANQFCNSINNLEPTLAKKYPVQLEHISLFFQIAYIILFSLNLLRNLKLLKQLILSVLILRLAMIRYLCGLLKSLLTIFLSLWHTFWIYQLTQLLSLLKWNWLVWFLYIYKSGDKSLLSNYRPLSLLPVFSKFLEKVVYNRLIRFFDKYEILCNNKYGFRKKHSTSLALLYLHDKITSAIDERKHTLGIFLDLYLKLLLPLTIVFYSISSSTLGLAILP